MQKVKVIGAGGYGGAGIVELLLKHPEVTLTCLVAKDNAGQQMSELYPHLKGFCDRTILGVDDEQAQEPADVVFFSTPDGVGMRQAKQELAKGAKVIDFSGDFRFNTIEDYQEYARRIQRDPEHASPELLPQSCYGLPELNLAQFDTFSLVGNPGCFASACLLGAAPAIAHTLVEPDTLIFDCKTGVSGAGKKPGATFHYPARYDNMNAYRLTGHQHVREIECMLGKIGGQEHPVTFTAQVMPATRGIMACIYARLKPGMERAAIEEAYAEYHQKHPFVRLWDRNSGVGTAHVRMSNFCNIIVDVDERTQQLRILSHIDNLMKGQAGNAMQAMNLMLGFPETLGLELPGNYP